MNSKMLNYLIVYGIGVVILWLVFDAFIMPMLPDGLGGPLFGLGILATLVVWAVVIIRLYESNE